MSDETVELSPLKRAFLAVQALQARVAELEHGRSEPIAVVGLSCRFPGAPDARRYWELLRDGVDAISPTPEARWNGNTSAGVGAADADALRWGGYLPSVDTFDPQLFGIAPREAAGMDPQQRLFLEVCWEALEDAGIAPDRLKGTPTGVFAGISTNDYASMQTRGGDLSALGTHYASGIAHSIVSGRISYLLGLNGPSVSLDTACSSSLVGVHLACQALRSGECNMALAGGVNVILLPDNALAFSRTGMLASDGRCKPFDASADGFVRGEGCGVIVLKRLSTAIADGDIVYALVRGSAVNQDGASSGMTAPSGPAQEAVIRSALRNADISPADVRWIEAHGTGTPLGDPIEVQAIGAALGAGRGVDDNILIGSVKSNIGHLEAAAGIAGLIKIVLALRNGVIPPSIHFHTPNPLIPWDRLPVRVATEGTPWVAGESPRIAGVSSFGFSGTNAHVVLSDAPAAATTVNLGADRPRHVLAWSAPSDTGLRSLAERYASHVAAHPDEPLADIAFSANVGRAHFRHRAAVPFGPSDDLAQRLRAFAVDGAAHGVFAGHMQGSDAPRVVFLFPGQGSQYAGMGRQLYETQPAFRRALDECDAIVGDALQPRVLDVIYPRGGEASSLDQTAYTQPALFAVEYALAALWQSWGVKPSAVMGHSLGEIVAATVAGVLRLDDALRLVVTRGRLGQDALANGAMAVVTASAARVAEMLEYLGSPVAVAAINGPENTVISGGKDAVTVVVDAFAAAGVPVKRLASTSAFHSAAADAMLPAFGAAASEISYGVQRIPIYSNLFGRRAAAGEMSSAAYWTRHVREPVQFAAGFNALMSDGFTIFLEAGPHTTLLGLGRQCFPESGALWLPSLRREHDDSGVLLGSLAQLYTSGVSIDWAAFDGGYARRRRRLPTYPFERNRYWVAPPRATAPDSGRGRAMHPLLARRIASPFVTERIFETELSLASMPWLAHHRVLGAAVLPTTAYLEAAWSAARLLHGESVAAIQDVDIFEALVTPEDATVTMQLAVAPESGSSATFRVVSARKSDVSATEEWRSHVSGTISLRTQRVQAQAPVDLAAIQARCSVSISPERLRDAVRDRGIDLGASFEGLRNVARGDHEALGFAEISEDVAADARQYGIHPALLDAALQVVPAALLGDSTLGESGDTFMPVGVEHYRMLMPVDSRLWSHVVVRPAKANASPVADVRIYDEAGELAAEVIGLQLRRVDAASWAAPEPDAADDLLYRVAWKPLDARPVERPNPGSVALGETWLVFADSSGVGDALAAELRGSGRDALLVRAASTFAASEHGFDIPLDDPVAYHTLLAMVAAQPGRKLAGMAHCWSLDATPSELVPISEIHAEIQAAEQRGIRSALDLVQAAVASGLPASSRLVFVTRGAQPVHDDVSAPIHAAVWGFASTVRLEHPDLDCLCVDLDPAEVAPIRELAARLTTHDEPQLAVRGQQWYAPRIVRLDRASAAASGTVVDAGRGEHVDAVAVVNTTPGVLDGLTYVAEPRRTPREHEVEIRVATSALNFRDVLVAMGMYPGAGPADRLGGECAGVVVAVGSAVTRFAAGDVVVAMAAGALGSHVTTHEELVLPVPAGMTSEQAVTLPTAFLTTWHSLYHLARLAPNERVLIHAGAGGVGLAAIQLAKRAGAEIFATAGSPAKRAFLESIGVDHVMDSRSLAYVDEIMTLTGGGGVDVALNSLADDHIERTFGLLRDGGRFIELGKRGILSQERARTLNPAVRYFVVDLAATATEQPAVVGAVLREVCAAAAAGEIEPLPATAFASADVAAAFRYMAQARHIGKVLVTRDDPRPAPGIRSDGSYLVTGGLGGLGMITAAWLVERGAGHVVLMSRGAADEKSQMALEDWNRERPRVSLLRGDVGNADDVRDVLAGIARNHPPLRGVFHAAGALNDGVILGKSWSEFVTPFVAKVDGTWNLHLATKESALDCFVLYSSISSILGSAGQGNYSAANAFLDAFAHYRRRAGLHALSIDWGAWSEVGLAVEHDVGARLGAQGMGMISPERGLAAMERALAANETHVAVMPVDWARFAPRFGRGHLQGSLFSEVASVGAARARSAADSGVAGRDAKAMTPSLDLRNASVAVRWDLLLQRMKQLTAQVLGLDPAQPIDEHRPLQELGLDSLMAVELRNMMKAEFALDRAVPATVVFDHPTVRALSDFVGTTLFAWGSADLVAAARDEPDEMDVLDRVTNLSPAEVERMLADRMSGGG